MTSQNHSPQILNVEELKTEAKWLRMEKINWQDENGKTRVWECANRTTRSNAGIDSVHILTLLHHPSKPVSTVLIEQYRPPIGKTVVELPAGLIDEGEDASTAALRELHEETGYGSGKPGDKQTSIERESMVVVKDPGMTGANCKLVTVNVELGENDEDPEQHLDEGEHITKKVVPLKDLSKTLDDYDKGGFAVDALLSSIAIGYELAGKFV